MCCMYNNNTFFSFLARLKIIFWALTFLKIILYRFCCALVYYTINYGSIYLGGNIYLSFFLVTLMILPSTFTSIICMNK